MRTGMLLVLLTTSQLLANALAGTPNAPFEINGVHIGQAIDTANKKLPALKCENSCVAENQLFFGKPGTFWAGIEHGKIAQLAFRFKPAIADDYKEKIRSFYIKEYGSPADNLGEKDCDEWKARDGFLVVCLTKEVSHVWWSKESRVDVNKRN